MKALVVALALTSMVALAEEDVGQTWSVVGARTLAPGKQALQADLGYPNLSVQYLYGIRSGINLGVRVGFAYGVEGMLREVAPGARAQFLLKLRFLDTERLSLGLVVEPGFIAYNSYLQGGRFGVALPIGLRLGIAASSAFQIGVSLDLPMWAEFGPFGGFNVPILTGVGAEYFVTSDLALFVRIRLGPTLRTMRPAEVTMDAAVGVAWRI